MGIFEIYNSWKNQLDSLNKPYYLKIWFFPEDVSKCQVVCAIDEFIDFYDVTFYKPKINKPFPFDKRGLNWQYCHQEHHLTIKDIDEPESFYSYQDYLDNKKWIEKDLTSKFIEVVKDERISAKFVVQGYLSIILKGEFDYLDGRFNKSLSSDVPFLNMGVRIVHYIGGRRWTKPWEYGETNLKYINYWKQNYLEGEIL